MNDLVILTIDLGGAKGDIQIEPGSEPEELAALFCKKHCLGLQVEKSLVNYLKINFFADNTKDCSINESPGKTSLTSNRNTLIKTPERGKVAGLKGETNCLPGERLYKKAIHALQLKRNFENEINSESRQCSSRLVSSSSRLMESLKRSKEKLDVKRKFYAREEMKECKFKPDINSKSPFLRKSSSKNRTTQLYEDYKIKQNKLLNKSQILLKKQCPFTPNIKNETKGKVDLEKTVERLHKFREKSQVNLEKMRAASRKMSEFDPETGQKLFKPQVHRRDESREKPVWEELYESSKRLKHSPINSSRMVLIDKNSQKISQKIRHKQFLKIFQDLSKDGQILKYSEIKIEEANNNMIQILNPVFLEMAEKNIELVFEEFCQALDALFKVLTPQEKSFLLFSYTKNPAQ